MPSRSSPFALIPVLASCGLAVSFTQTIVIPLLPTFPALLGASRSTVSWLVTATLVAGAVCAPVLGRLGDMYGKRRMLLVALAMIAAGSAIGTLAPNVGVLLAGRVLQGAALGVVPLITGVVADEVGWRWLFAGTAILATVQLPVVLATVRESPLRTGGSFDVVGALGFSTALVCLLLAVSKGGEWGWSGPYLPGLLATSAVLSLAWGGGNLVLAFAYNVLALPIAAGALYPAFGWLLSPIVAAAAMTLSSVSVIGNALRLRALSIS